MISLGKLLTETIHADHHLNRNNKDWLCDNGQPIKLRSPDNTSLGFSLDDKLNKLNHRIFAASPRPNITKMCDAIIGLSYRGQHYIFVVEKKTTQDDGHTEQLINGKIFCDWLIALFAEHGYVDQPVTYIALLLLSPRRIPRKGPSTHNQVVFDKMDDKLQKHFCKYARIENEKHIYLLDYLP